MIIIITLHSHIEMHSLGAFIIVSFLLFSLIESMFCKPIYFSSKHVHTCVLIRIIIIRRNFLAFVRLKWQQSSTKYSPFLFILSLMLLHLCMFIVSTYMNRKRPTKLSIYEFVCFSIFIIINLAAKLTSNWSNHNTDFVLLFLLRLHMQKRCFTGVCVFWIEEKKKLSKQTHKYTKCPSESLTHKFIFDFQSDHRTKINTIKYPKLTNVQHSKTPRQKKTFKIKKKIQKNKNNLKKNDDDGDDEKRNNNELKKNDTNDTERNNERTNERTRTNNT